jgi:hypothetical protein
MLRKVAIRHAQVAQGQHLKVQLGTRLRQHRTISRSESIAAVITEKRSRD